MKVIVAEHSTSSSSTGGRLGGTYLIGDGPSFLALSWTGSTAFPGDSPYAWALDPATGNLVFWGLDGSDPAIWIMEPPYASWSGPFDFATLIGVPGEPDKAFPADDCDMALASDGAGGLLALFSYDSGDGETQSIYFSRSGDGGDTWSARAKWTGGDGVWPRSGPVFGGGRWGASAYEDWDGDTLVARSDASTPTNFATSLSPAAFEDQAIDGWIGFGGEAWGLIRQGAAGTPPLKRCDDPALDSGAWQSPEHPIDSGHSDDIYEGNGAGGPLPLIPYPGGIKRLAREAGGHRTWWLRIGQSLLFTDEDDLTGWDKSLADHDAGSGAGMHPFLDYRRSNFTSGDFPLPTDVLQDPSNLDSLLFLGWTYASKPGVTYRRAVAVASFDGGDTFGSIIQLPVSSGNWGVGFVLLGSAGSTPVPAPPAPDKPARLSRDTIIFDFAPLPGVNLMRYLRGGEAWAFREREFQRLLYNQAPVEAPWVVSERARMPALLAEPTVPDGQLIVKPFDFDAGAAVPGVWQRHAGITDEPAQPIMQGLPTTRLVSDGSDTWLSLWQDLDVLFDGNPMTFAFVLRRGSVDRAGLWIWDPGINDDVYEVDFDLKQGISVDLYGTGSTRMIRLPTLGGAPAAWLVFVTVVGTDNEVPELGFMPTTRDATPGFTDVAYIGATRGERGVNPLDPGEEAGGTAWFPNVPALGESAWAGRLLLGQPAARDGDFFWHRGQLDGSAPRLALRCGPGSIYAEYDNGSDPAVQSAVEGLGWKEGDELAYVLNLFPGGAVHLALSLRGEAAKQGTASGDAAIADSQYDDAVVLIRGDQDQARCHHLRLMALHSSHLPAVPGTSSAAQVLERPHQFRVRTDGLNDPI